MERMFKVKLEHVSKLIRKKQILDDINMEMESGHIYGLQGINGSGKTMLLRAISGLIHTQGNIFVQNKKIGHDIDFPENMGLLIENPGFFPEFTAFENLRYLKLIQGDVQDDEIINILQKVGLNPTDRRKYSKFSLGMKERLGIAAAFLGDCKLILLDEPTNALDTDGMILLKNLILEHVEDALIIIASHDKEFLESVCNTIFVMEDGRIVEVKEYAKKTN